MATNIVDTSILMESLGKLRFDVDTYSEDAIRYNAAEAAGLLMSRLPDNYPGTLYGLQGVISRVIAEEFERLYKSQSDIATDRFIADMRSEVLFQNMGSLLTLGSKSVGSIGADGSSMLSDVEYRDYLTKVNAAYLGGSRKENIERSLNEILGVPVVVKELSVEARKPGSSYGLKDTHRLFCEIDMESQVAGNPVGNLVQDMDFYTDIIRPAHKLWETRLVWKDVMSVSGGCEPSVFGVDPNGNAPQIVTTANTSPTFYISSLKTGTTAPDGWSTGVIATLDPVMGVATTVSGDILVISDSTTFYTHDVEGEYRIDFSDLTVGATVVFDGMLSSGAPVFYSTPAFMSGYPYRAFNPDYYLLPLFQENVQKQMDARGRFELVEGNCPSAMVDRKVTDVLRPEYEDMRDDMTYQSTKPISSGYTASASQVSYTLGYTPVLGSSGNLAVSSDLTVYRNGVLTSSAVTSVDPLTGALVLSFPATAGDRIDVSYYFSKRFPRTVSYSTLWDFSTQPSLGQPGNLPVGLEVLEPSDYVHRLWWPSTPNKPSDTYQDVQVDKFPMLDALGRLAVASDVTVLVGGVEQPGSIVSIQPLLGHVRLSFTPPQGIALEVRYHYQDKPRDYSLRLDDVEGTLDAHYSVLFPYSLVMDQPDTMNHRDPVQSSNSIRKIGYRYRAYNLSNTAVLNSLDTLTTNMPDASGAKASLSASYGLTNEQDQLYSSEFLYDKSRTVLLNDEYLKNGLDPVLKLHAGVPPFQKTFTDRGDLSNPFTGSWDTQSGLVEYAPLADYRANNRIRLYSDLQMEETAEGTDVTMSSLSDGVDMGIAVQMGEEYFPYREMRLNDYMDYVATEQGYDVIPAVNPENPLDLSLMGVINGSPLVKSVNRNWDQVPVGALISAGGHSYTVIRRVNAETLQVHEAISLSSGTTNYSISTEDAPQVRVGMGDVSRRLVVDVSTGTPHSQNSGELGNTWGVPVFFPDPTPGPYPRNPANSTYPTPAPPLLDKQIHDDSGAVDLLLSAGEADKLVKWRNWDQLVFVVSTLVNPTVNAGDYPDARIRVDSAPGPGTYQLWQVDVKQVEDRGYVVVSTQQELFR